MAPRPFLLGNWKLHHTVAESRAFARAYATGMPQPPARLDVGIAPCATSLWALTELGFGDHVTLCAQDTFYEDRGAYTGALSAAQLRDVGARWVLVGHSERRRIFFDTNHTVAKRAVAAVNAGLRPILCVGESLEERQAGRGPQVLEDQVKAVLSALPTPPADLALAYEPVWAIGGRVAAVDDIAQAHAGLRAALTRQLGEAMAANIPIAYGGGVKEADVDALGRHPLVDGLLIGGASLSADSFVAIVAAMQRALEGKAP